MQAEPRGLTLDGGDGPTREHVLQGVPSQASIVRPQRSMFRLRPGDQQPNTTL
jgi:hypothetical protein